MSNKIDWVKVMEDNRDSIEEKIREAKKETFQTMQGWHIDVEVDEDGKVWTSNLHSHGSQSMSSWEGETYIVCRVDSWDVEVDCREEIKYDEKLYPEFLAQRDSEDGYDTSYDFVSNMYPEVLKEWENDATDYEISEFDASEILDRAIAEVM